MSHWKPKPLYRRLAAKGFRPLHVAEVGVHRPESSNVYDYALAGVRCTLVEPDPDCVALIRQRFAGHPNVTLHPVAVFDRPGQIELFRRGPSTFVADLAVSPALVNDRYRPTEQDKIIVEAKTFDAIDDGTIDLLSVDVEGSEWFVIKHLTSRPGVISVETHGASYRNPHLHEIEGWMEANGYWRLARTTSDSIYVKRGVVPVTGRDRAEDALVAVYLGYKRLAKRVKHAAVSRPA